MSEYAVVSRHGANSSTPATSLFIAIPIQLQLCPWKASCAWSTAPAGARPSRTTCCPEGAPGWRASGLLEAARQAAHAAALTVGAWPLALELAQLTALGGSGGGGGGLSGTHALRLALAATGAATHVAAATVAAPHRRLR